MSDSGHGNRDFPFYEGSPVALGWLDWLIVLGALSLAFAALAGISLAPWTGGAIDGVLRVALFVGIPLLALAWRAGSGWKALFHGWRWSYLGWGVLFGIVNLAFTYALGSYAIRHIELSPNGVVTGLREGGAANGMGVVYLTTGIQLLGEELITILPFLFVLWLAVSRWGMSRTPAILLAWVASALLFGAIHLPTYGWNVVQALLLIGPVRLVLTLAYIKTKSIWASTIAHIVNDWSMFTLAVVLGGAAAAG